MNDTEREKHWQVIAGRMAAIANWALVELLNAKDISSNVRDQANEELDEVIPYLDFGDEDDEA